jgi:hypothetical protein
MADPVAFRIDDLPELATFRERSAEIRATVKETHDVLASAGWDTLRDTACAKLVEGLKHEDGLAWLAFAWTKAKELKAAARETLGDGAPERLVPLAAHSLSQEVCPVVTLSCGPAELELKFTIELSGDIDCADLVVRGGRLVAIQAGQLTPAAALSFRGVALGEKKGDPIDLTRPYTLPRGGFRLVDAQAAEEEAKE